MGQGSRVDVALLDSQSALLIYRAVITSLPGKSLCHQGLGMSQPYLLPYLLGYLNGNYTHRVARYVAGTGRAIAAAGSHLIFRKNKGLASFLTTFVENLGKTCPPGGPSAPFSRGLAILPITYVFLQ